MSDCYWYDDWYDECEPRDRLNDDDYWDDTNLYPEDPPSKPTVEVLIDFDELPF